LRKQVDSLIVINNNKLREVYGNLGFKAGFSKADEVLATASRGIAEVITHHYTQNIDLKDAKTVLSNSGTAIMGSATAIGANRAKEAIIAALDSPLLDDNKITGAKNVLLLIVSGSNEITIDEIGEISDHIQAEAGYNANIIMGVGEDETLGESIAVTIIATGFNIEQQNEIVNTEPKKIIHSKEMNFEIETPKTNINEINVVEAKQITKEEQIAFTFDMPAPQSIQEDNRIIFDLSPETRDIKVNQHVEFVPVTELSDNGVIKYSLEEYMELENELINSKQAEITEVKEPIAEELNFTFKVEEAKQEEKKPAYPTHFEDASPVEMSIEEILKHRANERRSKLKDFNYK
jgi:cell division protein FtsZ